MLELQHSPNVFLALNAPEVNMQSVIETHERSLADVQQSRPQGSLIDAIVVCSAQPSAR